VIRCTCPTTDRGQCWTIRHGSVAVALEQEFGLPVSCSCVCHQEFEGAREPGEEG
jgi:hypothetical protein